MASCVIIDGAAIVQMLHPKNSRSFSEYASDVRVSYRILGWGGGIKCVRKLVTRALMTFWKFNCILT